MKHEAEHCGNSRFPVMARVWEELFPSVESLAIPQASSLILPMEKSESVGVIGMGIIGSRVAECLRQAGRDVYVWSRTPKPIPNFLGSASDVFAVADVVQIFVSDSAALREVITSVKDHLEPRHIVLANGTFAPDLVYEVSKMVKTSGAAFLDAPFTGSKNAAEAGELVYYVGGAEEDVERVRPVLEVSAKAILHLGKIGEASILKIATNTVSAAVVGALAEAYGLVGKAGIDPEKLVEALDLNACCSPLVKMKLPTMIEKNYETHFALKHMFKDVQYALNLGKTLSVEQPVASTMASVMYRIMQQGKGDLDYSAIAAKYPVWK